MDSQILQNRFNLKRTKLLLILIFLIFFLIDSIFLMIKSSKYDSIKDSTLPLTNKTLVDLMLEKSYIFLVNYTLSENK